jgi:hypothetical protein
MFEKTMAKYTEQSGSDEIWDSRTENVSEKSLPGKQSARTRKLNFILEVF